MGRYHEQRLAPEAFDLVCEDLQSTPEAAAESMPPHQVCGPPPTIRTLDSETFMRLTQQFGHVNPRDSQGVAPPPSFGCVWILPSPSRDGGLSLPCLRYMVPCSIVRMKSRVVRFSDTVLRNISEERDGEASLTRLRTMWGLPACAADHKGTAVRRWWRNEQRRAWYAHKT